LNVAFQIVSQNAMNVKTVILLLELIPLSKIYRIATNQKNDAFVKVIMQLQKYPNLIEPLNKRIKNFAEGMKNDTQDTFVLF
jgi:hypothetical protein